MTEASNNRIYNIPTFLTAGKRGKWYEVCLNDGIYEIKLELGQIENNSILTFEVDNDIVASLPSVIKQITQNGNIANVIVYDTCYILMADIMETNE